MTNSADKLSPIDRLGRKLNRPEFYWFLAGWGFGATLMAILLGATQ